MFHRLMSVMAWKSSTRLTENRLYGKWMSVLSLTASGRTELILPEICGNQTPSCTGRNKCFLLLKRGRKAIN